MINERTALIVVIVSALVMLLVWAEYFFEKAKREPKSLSELGDPKGESKLPPSATPEAHDPRIVAEFLDERRDQLYKKTAVRLTNTGGSEALDVHIDAIPLRGQQITFPRTVGVMVAGSKERFDPKTEGRSGIVNTSLFVKVLQDEWDTYKDIKMTALSFPLRISYSNFAKTASFETKCDLLFYPYRERMNLRSPNPKPVVEFLNYDFKKQPYTG